MTYICIDQNLALLTSVKPNYQNDHTAITPTTANRKLPYNFQFTTNFLIRNNGNNITCDLSLCNATINPWKVLEIGKPLRERLPEKTDGSYRVLLTDPCVGYVVSIIRISGRVSLIMSMSEPSSSQQFVLFQRPDNIQEKFLCPNMKQFRLGTLFVTVDSVDKQEVEYIIQIEKYVLGSFLC